MYYCPAGESLHIKVSHHDIYTSTDVTATVIIPLEATITDVALKKVVLLKHFVDLHNDYVMEKKGVKHLERFQSFKKYLLQEMEDVKDNSLAFNNKGTSFIANILHFYLFNYTN